MPDEIKLPLSAVIIAKNEESNIARAIASVVDWVSEVVVYDSGSQDKTTVIAKSLGAKVYEGGWMGFGKTKTHVAGLAANDWILSIDCDEEVSGELRREIIERFKSLDPSTAYRIPRKSFFVDRWIGYGGWFPDYQARLFNRNFSMWNSADIHEKVEAENYQNLLSHLKHYVFIDISHQVRTNDYYSGLQASEMHKKNIEFSWFKFLTKPPFKFFECYFLKQGFRDGWVGFVIAVSAAYSVFLKWAKLKEMGLSKGRGKS